MERMSCFVIGAGSGVSRSIALEFANAGYAIGLVARRKIALEDLSYEVSRTGAVVESSVGDAADTDSLRTALDSLAERLGNPAVVVYNAVAPRQAKALDLQVADAIDDLRTNFGGALVTAQWVARAMPNGGTYLITGGVLATNPFPMYTSLGVGKAAVRNLALSLHTELKPANIHVATVTIGGFIKPGTAFDPDLISKEFLRIHQEPKASWTKELVFDGKSSNL